MHSLVCVLCVGSGRSLRCARNFDGGELHGQQQHKGDMPQGEEKSGRGVPFGPETAVCGFLEHVSADTVPQPRA
jgi:hypothetical protein